ncbi:MAG: thioredoxin family protein [Candidatus Pacebacteria bacterium]|nr:thioredoxin family protein [Candidatus Paceibacterota bacterium]
MEKMNRWKIATLILAVVCVIMTVMLSQTTFAPSKKPVNSAVEYINKYLLQSGMTAKLDKIETERTAPFQKVSLDINGQKFFSYVSVDGKYLYAQEPIDISKAPDGGTGPEMSSKEAVEVEGSFKEIKEVEVCKENDKPIVYFFGSSTCPHCEWEEPILKSVIQEFGDAVAYHENIDTETDIDVFSKYSSGGVPTLVIGCKYYRNGSGEAIGEVAEEEALRKVICRATGNLPASICQ